MRDLTVDSWRYLLVNRSSTHLSPIGSHLHYFMKLLTCTEDDHAHYNHHLVSDLHPLSPAPPLQYTHTSQNCRQSSLKSLLNTFGMFHKTHGMVTRYGSQDTEDIPDTQDCTPLDLTQQDHHVPERDNNSSDEYCEETNAHCPLADFIEQFQ